MPDAVNVIRAYTRKLRPDDLPGNYRTHLLGTKYTPGGEPVSATVPLTACLVEQFDADVHFTQYTSPAEVRCVKSETSNYALTFTFAAFDLDYMGHKGRPQADHLVDLVRTFYVYDHVPNLLYPTRGGARILYLIEPITDADEFEGRYQTLLDDIATHTGHSPYKIDTHAKDWTRLFRAPSVVRDGVQCKVPTLLYHTEPLDLRTFGVKSRSIRKPLTIKSTKLGADNSIMLGLRRMEEGNRNATVYRLLCRVRDRYTEAAAARWVEAIRERALAQGMEDREFETTYRSAMK